MNNVRGNNVKLVGTHGNPWVVLRVEGLESLPRIESLLESMSRPWNGL